jgi:hypothetical protein
MTQGRTCKQRIFGVIRRACSSVAKSAPSFVARFENMVQHHLNSLRLTTKCTAAEWEIVAVLQKEQGA